MLLSYIVVDPNPIQRLHLAQIFKKIKTLKFEAEFLNAVEAQNFLNYNSVDLIFLASELPVYSGFDFITKLYDPVEIVLLTENPQDALKAFELNIADCIAPPYKLERIEQSVLRIHEKIKNQRKINTQVDDFIEIKHNLTVEKITTNSIKWIEAMGDYVKIITPKKKYLVLSTMKAFLEKLPEDQFFRIHKSYIINLKKVINYGASKVNLDGKELPLSRSQKKQFRLSVSKFQ